ncbi:MAG TPA: hypothetical protein VGR19_11060 [Allosphingosinicella sp.]|nr:hypothetical protein [Allosphingosinicella sp.]
MLDRLSNEDVELDAARARNLLLALSHVMDDLAGGAMADFGGPDIWRRGKRAIPRLLRLLGDQRIQVIREMFAEGSAMGWLSSIFRDEIFAHGRYGDRPSSKRLFTAEELDLVGEALVARYRGLTFADFAALPQPLSTLFAWQQGGDPEGPRVLLSKAMETDDGLLFVLENISGISQVATPSYSREVATLSRSNIAALVDYEAARSRIETLAADTSLDGDRRCRASKILESFKNGDRF